MPSRLGRRAPSNRKGDGAPRRKRSALEWTYPGVDLEGTMLSSWPKRAGGEPSQGEPAGFPLDEQRTALNGDLVRALRSRRTMGNR
jgi:hypothetical protein